MLRSSLLKLLLLLLILKCGPALAVIRDGGIDPANLGKGDWIYSMTDATNKLGGHVNSVTNETSLMKFYRSQGIRYIIIKAATSDSLFNGCYVTPQFTTALVNIAHTNGILIFGYNRSYGSNVVGEITISDYIFNQGADGFVWDAEAEWESSSSWIGANGPTRAWHLCGSVRTNWPNKFLAHAPFPIIYLHSSFPYKEFSYWSDAVMPQIYHSGWTGVKGRASGGVNWSDVNWRTWQSSLIGASSVIGGQTIYWTNSIKPLVPLENVYGGGGSSPCEGGTSAQPFKDVMEFIDYVSADPNGQTAGGYNGVNFWRTDLHGAIQWGYIAAGSSGSFPGIIANIVVDDPNAAKSGLWTSVLTFSATTTACSFTGNGSGTDTNSFGTNYLTHSLSSGADYVQFTPQILVPGDYNIYQWHPYRTDASASVPFVITYSSGAATNVVNQQTNAGDWNFIGKYNFAAGTAGSVRVTDAATDSGKVAIADGIKWVFVASNPPAIGPTIISQPQSQTLAVGQSATFPVIASGTAPLYYQWRFNGANIGGATDTSLTLNLVQLTNAGSYSVWVTNMVSSVLSSNALLAVLATGAWGDNSWGQTNSQLSLTDIVAIAAGEWHSMALRANGSVVAWGDDVNGQCDVPAGLTNAVAIAAGGYHSLAITADGKVAAWGNSDYGQTNLPATLTQPMAISGGKWHTLGLQRNGTVVAWGDNSFSQCNVPPGLSNVTAIAAGGNHSLVLLDDGSLRAWGDNNDAEGFFAGQSIVPPGLSNVVAIGAGDYHSLAVQAGGTVVAWGDNSQGQCGVPPGLSNVVSVAGGGAHTLALLKEGSVAAWGANWNGQCAAPVLNNVVGVAAGQSHSLALIGGTLPTLKMLSPARQANHFSVLAQTMNRKSYAIEYAGSLSLPNWIPLATNSGNGGLLLFSDPVAAAAQRFYRLRDW